MDYSISGTENSPGWSLVGQPGTLTPASADAQRRELLARLLAGQMGGGGWSAAQNASPYGAGIQGFSQGASSMLPLVMAAYGRRSA